MRLSPDAMLAGNCSAQNLNGFSPALIGHAQAASGNSATLRKCDLNFTGTEFVNRWLAQDGAKQGLNAEEARAKYLAGTLLVSLDPQTADDPLAMQLASAGQIFLSQPVAAEYSACTAGRAEISGRFCDHRPAVSRHDRAKTTGHA